MPQHRPSNAPSPSNNYIEVSDQTQLPTDSPNIENIPELTKRIALDIEKLQAEAIRYEEAALAARQKSALLQNILNSYLNSTLPLFRLPDEILTVIVEQCVEADTTGHALSNHAITRVLARTSRRWRRLVLSTPSLWKIVRVNTVIHKECPQSWETLLRSWLQHSEPLPISCLAIFGEIGRGGYNMILLQLLISQAYRWHHVDFDFGSDSALYYQLTHTRSHMAHLCSLYLAVAAVTDEHASGNTSQAFLFAPELREATLFNDITPGARQIILTLPWSQLQELSWSVNTPCEFLDVTPHLSTLRYCYLEIASDTEVDDRQVVTLSHLRHLEVYGPYLGVIKLLDHLTLPSLGDFGMHFKEFVNIVGDLILSTFVALQKRSSCHPGFLSSHLMIFSSPSLEEGIETVEELSLEMGTIIDNTQALFNLRTIKLFRKLRILHVLFEDLSETLLSQLADVMEARCRPTSDTRCLEQLSLEVIQWDDRPKTLLSTRSPSFRRILDLQRHGLALQGEVIDGVWHSRYRDTRWCAGDVTKDERRWARFGYCDWLKDSIYNFG
ncbi:hypothetical protein Moror_13087 [Moniliophthora roreri MCA 2997]|uniref:Uncharacterized protein n=2 Tax=Moniliophthora roreri TaxID=221103 RepID=V2XJC9_MONRO|nr:hypothetical protein Moror_13087 [Moniliophthora roreri MCA 2997]KAI3604844.1 hypothetical protein WG66_008243 [Moniliophthora roreri]